MPVKTLGDIEVVRSSGSRTYSVHSIVPTSSAGVEEAHYPSELEYFLAEENPLGCIRGVMWVMVFNAAAFLLGFAIWESFRHMW